MKTLDFIKDLGYGVLNNTSYRQLDWQDPDSVLSLVALIQEGLTRLYTRFIIREKHVIVEMQVGVTFYHLNSLYSVQNDDRERVPYPYIMDLPNEPFQDDVIKVLEVVDSAGVTRPINDSNNVNSVHIVQYDVIQNPCPRYLECLFVTYQAKHIAMISYLEDGQFVVEDEIFLPDALVPALSNYVAYMVFSRINTPEGVAKASGHLAIYEQVCRDVESMDLLTNSISGTNSRFSQNGWA